MALIASPKASWGELSVRCIKGVVARSRTIDTCWQGGEQSGTATDLSEKLVPLGGAGNPLVWAIIWTNLGYNSVIVRWYMKYAKHSNIYDSPELVFMLGDYYAATTRKKRHQLVIRDF